MTRNLCAPCALSVSPWRQRGLAPAAASDALTLVTMGMAMGHGALARGRGPSVRRPPPSGHAHTAGQVTTCITCIWSKFASLHHRATLQTHMIHDT